MVPLIEQGSPRPAEIPNYSGVVFIGDPHLESRQPGFRKDNYLEAILSKLSWILDMARQDRLLPVFLGDLFERPRDNPNRLVGRLMELFSEQDCLTIYGNHDCSEPVLTEDDSLSLLLKGSRLQLLTPDRWGLIQLGEQLVVIGGSSYRQPVPSPFFPPPWATGVFTCWVTHHDLAELDGPLLRNSLRESSLSGIDAVINGHLHRFREEVRVGETCWLVPGNISRRSRHEATANHRPHVLVLSRYLGSLQFERVEVPHLPPEDVFHERIMADDSELNGQLSIFVTGLAELEALRTDSGAGLIQFLAMNRHQFSPPVCSYIEQLRQEVMENVEAHLE